MQFAPEQAAHTAATIRAAGRSDVCSVCGDEPARDYFLEDDDLPMDAVSTLRLCSDCLTIRRADGEDFKPLV
jgi:hypothetical protein